MSISGGSLYGQTQSPRLDVPGKRDHLCRKHPQGAGEARSRKRGHLQRKCRRLHGKDSRKATNRFAFSSKASPKASAGWRRARVHSPTSPSTTASSRSISWPINADQQDSPPQQVQHLIDAMRTNKVPVIFSESTVSDKPAKQAAKETGARYGGVLYVDSLTDPSGPAPTLISSFSNRTQTP